MPLTFEKSVVLRRLAELDRRDPGREIFGSCVHQYKINPPLPTSLAEAVEGLHGISLPEDYRSFITEVGNGGAGPYYGLFPFGKYGYSSDFFDWDDAGLIGDLSKPFSLETVLIDPASLSAYLEEIDRWLLDLPEAEEPNRPSDTPLGEDRQQEGCDGRADGAGATTTVVNGAIPICHMGCGHLQWLAIRGEQRGFVWNDWRAEDRGMTPVLGASGNPVAFGEWYMGWVNDSIRKSADGR
jgi:hypothetical protein